MKAHHVVCFSVAALALMPACKSASEPLDTETPQPASRVQPKVEPAADNLLRRMSDYLGGLQTFTVQADHTIEVVLDSGQKVEFSGSSRVSVQRPNKLRSDRRGDLADAAFYYDGKTVTIYGKRKQLYAQAAAPDTIDKTIDFARDKLDLEAPGADLLFSNPYNVLMEDAISGLLVGPATIGGIPCQHLAYHGKGLDWQVWIQDGDKPVPLKYTITTTDIPAVPEFTVVMHDWNTSPKLPADEFTFSPPPEASKIEFLRLMAKR